MKNFINNNSIPKSNGNTKLVYNGQCKSTILIKQGKFTLTGNSTNTMDI